MNAVCNHISVKYNLQTWVNTLFTTDFIFTFLLLVTLTNKDQCVVNNTILPTLQECLGHLEPGTCLLTASVATVMTDIFQIN